MAKTFKEIQAEVMEIARKNDMDEADAMSLLRSRVRAAGLKMANGKVHMYSGGGNVTDKMNPGLKALAKERPDVVKRILNN
jgi:hypothetical protein